mmetsp:Transcript_10015/g.34903  ORF Transcript_10015/g.34903 Transcript_10015/m.34903 type:complete len:88 (+) Transcript_10015:2755-3018(+)
MHLLINWRLTHSTDTINLALPKFVHKLCSSSCYEQCLLLLIAQLWSIFSASFNASLPNMETFSILYLLVLLKHGIFMIYILSKTTTD